MSGWADVELVVVSWLSAETSATASLSLPARLEESLPRIRVAAAGGSDDWITDSALVDVETFAASRAAAADLAEEARQAMHDLAAEQSAGALVDSVTTATRPVFVDYDNPKVSRYVATYRLTLRRP